MTLPWLYCIDEPTVMADRNVTYRWTNCPATDAVDNAVRLMTVSFGKVQRGTAPTDLSTL